MMKRGLKGVYLVCIISLLLLLTILSSFSAFAALDIVDSGRVGEFSSIDVAGSSVFVSYYDRANGNLKFVRSSNLGGGWETPVTVDPARENVGQYSSLHAVNQDVIYISYWDTTNNMLKFAWTDNGGLGWDKKTVENAADGRYNSITEDDGIIYISYYNDGVKLARSVDGGETWGVIPVAGATLPKDGRFFTSVKAFGDEIFIGFFHQGDGSAGAGIMKLAHSTTGGNTWQIIVIDKDLQKEGEAGYTHSSMDAVDAETIFFSYNMANLGGSRALGFKTFSPVDGVLATPVKVREGAGAVGQFTSIYSLTADVIMISNYYTNTKEIQYAYSLEGGVGGSWQYGSVHKSNTNKGYTSIAANTDKIFVSYWDAAEGLKVFSTDYAGPEIPPEASADKAACEASDGRWLDAETNNRCCGDQESDNGYISSGGDFLCYKESGQWDWKSAKQEGHAFIIKTVSSAAGSGGSAASGNKDITSNSEQWFVCDEGSANSNLLIDSASDRTEKANAAKFTCVKHDNNYLFLECCVPDDSGEKKCNNDLSFDPARVFSPGGTTASLIKDEISELFKVSDDVLELSSGDSASHNLEIRDWSDYSTLVVVFSLAEHFDVFLEITDDAEKVLSYRLIDYVTNTPMLNKQMVANIPLGIGNGNIKKAVFRFLPGYGQSSSYNNHFVITSMYLTSQVSELLFCSGTGYLQNQVDSLWIGDIDSPVKGLGDEPEGKSACEGAGYGWTGTQCCGDDKKEYYNDVEAGCWGGNLVESGKTAMDVAVEVDGILNYYFCPGEECIYPLFGAVTNPFPGLYSFNTGTGVLEASSIPQQMVFYDQQFSSCNAEDYVKQRTLTAAQACSIKPSCSEGEVELLELSSGANAHAALPGKNLYDLKLCCGGITGLSNDCSASNNEEVLVLSSEINAHSGEPDISSYGYPICISAPDSVEIDCSFSTTPPTAQHECFFSISGEKNAHIAACGFYEQDLFCSIKETSLETNPIEESEFCSVKGDYFCSPLTGGWSDESLEDIPSSYRNASKELHPNKDPALGTLACCPSDRCWDGATCIANMAGKPDIEPIDDYRCIEGSWSFTPLVYTWDGLDSAYCNSPTQCLVRVDGDPSVADPLAYFSGADEPKPQCIESGGFILDYYCSDHEWITRTKLVAYELMQFIERQGDLSLYTLYCDSYENALVDSGYPLALERILGVEKQLLEETCFDNLKAPCTNNFCVMDYQDNTGAGGHIVAASLNKPVNDPSSSFLLAIEKNRNFCDNVPQENRFSQCGDSSVWYNPILNAVVYSRTGVNLQGDSFIEKAGEWFTGIIQNALSWLTGSGISGTVEADIDFLERIKQFSRLYLFASMLDGVDKSISAVQEVVGEKSFILAEYHGSTSFQDDLCTYVNNAARVKAGPGGSGELTIKCQLTSDGVYHIFTKDPEAIERWQEFTSALRAAGVE